MNNKQTNKNTKLHKLWAQGARITPLENSLQQKKNVETNLSNAILNSNNNNNDDIIIIIF